MAKIKMELENELTFKECFKSWFGDYKKQLSGELSERTVINGFEYMTPLYNKRMCDITGHRAGLWNIPMLDRLKGKARNDWINSHNTSGKKYKDSDWKNAGLKKRQASVFPREMLEEKLAELQRDG